MQQFFVRRWFLLLLVVVLGVGFTQETWLRPAAESTAFKNLVVASALFLTAFPLRFGTVAQSLTRPWAPALAIAVNYGLLPLTTWGLYFGLRPLVHPDIAIGLLIFSTTPCTLASAAVWTRRAGGNDTAAIMVTIATNLTCFAVLPLWIWIMTGSSVESVRRDAWPLVRDLLLLVVVPILAAQALRLAPAIGAWATRHKAPLGVASQLCVLTMVLLGAVNAGLRLNKLDASEALGAADVFWMLLSVLAVHLSMLVTGLWLARLSRLPRGDQIAVAFAGSQKTLIVGLSVVLKEFPQYGLAVLPMVAYHVSQLVVDTVIADAFARGATRAEPLDNTNTQSPNA